jgi:serine/threonine protein phosphatase PrpC
VWLPYDDSPGLAMARAFGDFCLKDYGVISVPEMSYRQLTERDLFIVLASDGVCSLFLHNWCHVMFASLLSVY